MATEVLACDERGRVVLPKDVRLHYGKEFHLVKARGEIILIPVSKDSLSSFQELGKRIPKKLSVAQIKGRIRKRALMEALGNVR